MHKPYTKTKLIWGDTPREDPGMSKGSSGHHGGLFSEGTPMEDPRMSKGSSGHHGGLCLKGHQRRIPGCPRDPPDSMEHVWERLEGRIPGCPRNPMMSKGSSRQLCERDMKGGSQDVQGILQTAVWEGHEGRIPGCPRDSPDGMGSLLRGTWREGPWMSWESWILPRLKGQG